MRTIIVAGPRRGKSTLAERLAAEDHRCQVYCGDPLSKVKEPKPGVVYLPEGIPFSGDDGAAQWIAETWFGRAGHWVCEGHVMARALRRWLVRPPRGLGHNAPPARPCDRIIVLDRPAFVASSPGQEAMHKAVMTVWDQIALQLDPIPGLVIEHAT